MLSQLSYSPVSLVGLGGLEPPTSPLSGVCSSHLSYRPEAVWFPVRLSARFKRPDLPTRRLLLYRRIK